MPWFHGGKPGLDVGDLLLPPTVTGNATLGQHIGPAEDPEGVYRPDRVFLTTSPRWARCYAGLFPDGDVYEVLPLGRVEQDPDCAVPGFSVMVESARIVRVVRFAVPPAFSRTFLAQVAAGQEG